MSSPIFPKMMTCDRFDALTSALYFADNETDHPAEDRLWKPRPVLDVLDETFSAVFVPNKTVSVDQSFWAVSGPSTCPIREQTGLEGLLALLE